MTDIASKKLGAMLLELRKQRGDTQEQFAAALGIERARYGRIERGELNITLAVLFGISGTLGVLPAQLLAKITVEDCRNEAETARATKTDRRS